MKKGIVFVVSGPSGAGKSTIIKEALKNNRRIRFSISATTRKKRRGEQNGVHYFFVPEKKFKEMIRKDQFLEWAKFQNNFYGTPRAFVQETIERGFDCIMDIDVQGALQVMKKVKDAVFIFIAPKSLSVLKHRLFKRKTEGPNIVEKRLLTAHKEMQCIDMYDYFVINEKLIDAVNETNHIIMAERNRVSRNSEITARLKQKI